ncbi:MAG: hypothetical protein WD768_07370 [Phycisphaeraceae bacterium]
MASFAAAPTGNASIRAKAGDSDIIITTTQRLAGAIHSLTFRGVEYINSTDHGRQLQSASNLNLATHPYHSETFNPTEAGSRSDHIGPISSSKLLKLEAKGNELKTTIQMAFWLRPGEKSEGHPAINKTVLSDHLIAKHVTIGTKDMAQVIQYDVTFTVPKGEHHTWAQFEALTGYMPQAFSKFYRYVPAKKELEPISEGPGEQQHPIIFSTPDGRHAMGIYSPDQPSKGFEHAGYGRWNFKEHRVVKWNCVFRVKDNEGVKPGDYSYRNFVLVGTLEEVTRDMSRLHEMNKP